MTNLLKNKWISTGLMLAVVLALAYYVWTSSSSDTLLSANGGPSQSSQEILASLARLHTIKLDESIFSDPTFQSLSDYGVTIPPQPAGRRNPFAPLGTN